MTYIPKTWINHHTTALDADGLNDWEARIAAGVAGAQPLDSDLTAIAALTTTSFGRALLELADAAAARTAVDSPSNADLAAALALPVQLLEGACLLTGAAGSGTKYLLVPGTSNASAQPSNNAAAGQPFTKYLDASEYPSIAGNTCKLKVRGMVTAPNNNPSVTVTFGLYPVTIATGSWTAGTLVASSDVAVVVNTTNAPVSGESAAFSIPSTGTYALVATLSGAPAQNIDVHARLSRVYV